MKVLCATPECKWCDEDYYCTAEEVHLNSASIMTMWDGRQVNSLKCRSVRGR